MQRVPVGRASLYDYAPFVGYENIVQIKTLADNIHGASVLHVSSTPYGGGVAELLHSLVPLMNDLGLRCEWHVLERDDGFFTITKLLHNSLQGMPGLWSAEMAEAYLAKNVQYAQRWSDNFDFVVVHDPQPVAIPWLIMNSGGEIHGRWIWRCHIDLTAPDLDSWRFVRAFLDPYDALIFSAQKYVPPEVMPRAWIIAPSIDPLSPKNAELGADVVQAVVSEYGMDVSRPIVLQVSRFDPWKDQVGVIFAFEAVRKRNPKPQLALVGSMADDDPEGFHYYQKTAELAEGSPDVFLLTNLEGIGNIAVNAFQRAADIVVQKSIREGFGLTVTEALWKRKAVIGGNVGGISLQIQDGVNGFLVDSVEECAEKLVYLLDNPEVRESFGAAGREWIRRQFLTPRNLFDYLLMFNQLGLRRGPAGDGNSSAAGGGNGS